MNWIQESIIEADLMDDTTIIIRVKNEEDWIGHSIQSVIDNIKNAKIIVVDNSSTDSSLNIARLFKHDTSISKSERYVDLEIINIEKYSPGRAINQAVKLVNTKSILLLSSHCEIIEYSENLVNNLLEKHVAIFGKQIPRYFGKNRTYHIPRLEETLEKFKDAKLFAEENGVRIFNATIGGELEVFERANFSNLFNVNPNKELRLSLSSILTDFEVEKISGDTFSDVFPSATVYNTIEDFNFEEETSIIKNTLGTKIVSKLIKEYTVIGPVNNEFFVKRRT